ncbi:hypothetical protein KQ944_18075 [Bacillus subtilis]|uniref:hypothetical protein n=1 Tax=Pseudochrobactrum asaccharolyticum TaxID=354351 RepID=UPI001F2A38D1|nr:hypothetical protein [Pseudochrobactrum asaccharolyticum]MCF7646905.1 hypothetical protein [Pseudochrobactrum asaccharolyticum]MCF7673547.1 hypothetical protein [Bacillus subtilis]
MEHTKVNKKSVSLGKKIGQALLIGSFIFAGLLLIERLTDDFPKSCNELVNPIVQLSKDNAPTQGNALIIDVVEVKEHSNNEGALECSGLGILSNGLKQQIRFRQYQEYEKWWIKYEAIGLPQNR